VEVLVSALHHIRSAPTRAVVRLQSIPAADREAGMTTAEYAVGTVAACGFSGLLYKLVTSPEVMGLLRDVITKAFRLGF
jgi:hypothetical protein